MKPAARRQVAAHWRDAFGVSERRAAHVIAMHRSTVRYKPRPDQSAELREQMRRLAAECPRAGYRLMLDRIRWRGALVNHKRVYRLYRQEGLNVIDDFSRECLAIEVGASLPGIVVTRVLDRIAATRGYPAVS